MSKKQKVISAANYLRRGISEHQLQRQVVELLDTAAKPNVYAFAIPNEAKRSFALARTLKAQGMRAGVADLCILFAGGKTAWLEFKTAKGVQSDAQHNFEEICVVLGHPYAVVRTFAAAEAILTKWGAL